MDFSLLKIGQHQDLNHLGSQKFNENMIWHYDLTVFQQFSKVSLNLEDCNPLNDTIALSLLFYDTWCRVGCNCNGTRVIPYRIVVYVSGCT